jgi:hypothetical protein
MGRLERVARRKEHFAMSQGNGASAAPPDEAPGRSFESLKKAILAEWPVVDGAALDETAGDLEKVVELVAKVTEHTRALVRRQLAELQSLDAARGRRTADAGERAVEIIERLEQRTTELVKELRGTALAYAKAKARENIFTTILAALGIGLILGLLFGGRRGRG